MIAFNLKQFAISNNSTFEQLQNWLVDKGNTYNFKRTIKFSDKKYEKLIQLCLEGIKCKFQTNYLEDKILLNIETNSLNRIINESTETIQALKSKIERLKKQSQSDSSLKHQAHELTIELDQIRLKYKKRKAEEMIKYDSIYQIKLKKKKEFELKIKKGPDSSDFQTLIEKAKQLITEKEKQIEQAKSKIEVLDENKRILANYNKIKKTTAKPVVENKPSESRNTQIKPPDKHEIKSPVKPEMKAKNKSNYITVSVEWKDVSFFNGYILIKYKGRFLDKYPVKKARKSFNSIHSHYKFRNSPKLSIVISYNKVVSILNIEVLFYYIQFWENAGTLFTVKVNSNTSILNKYQSYTKSFYKKHLPELFQPRYFDYLCEYSINDLPIIPVGEIVINSSGAKQIHDSFLFPFKGRTHINWLWESTEESKATYIFKTSKDNLEIQLQTIFDFLTGDTVNKRETLIKSKALRTAISLRTRVLHTTFSDWKYGVKQYDEYL